MNDNDQHIDLARIDLAEYPFARIDAAIAPDSMFVRDRHGKIIGLTVEIDDETFTLPLLRRSTDAH